VAEDSATSAVCVSSAGGVFLDALAVSEMWEGPVRWIAVRAPDTEARLVDSDVRWRSEVGLRQPIGLLHSYRDANRELKAWRPSWVISAGTGIAAGWFLAAYHLGIPSLWIETLNIYGDQGLAATLCSRLADRVIVQRPQQLTAHRRAMLLGELY
jgi:UDP-N-acetylglucosamine:LPS N-acetylglucosamine transferase